MNKHDLSTDDYTIFLSEKINSLTQECANKELSLDSILYQNRLFCLQKTTHWFTAINVLFLFFSTIRLYWLQTNYQFDLDFEYIHPSITHDMSISYDWLYGLLLAVCIVLFLYPRWLLNRHDKCMLTPAMKKNIRASIGLVCLFSALWLYMLNYYHDFHAVMSGEHRAINAFLVAITFSTSIIFSMLPRLSLVMLLTLMTPLFLDHHINADLIFMLGFIPLLVVNIVCTKVFNMVLRHVSTREYSHSRLLKAVAMNANLDPLLGIANRRAFFSRSENIINRLSPGRHSCALLMLDVDHFKKYNDHYGHQQGDLCLKTVAECLTASIRTDIDLLARYGGEEFIALLPNTTANQATVVAERIRTKLQERAIPHATSETSPHVTISIGIAQWYPHLSLPELCAQADRALYDAKRKGRDGYSCYAKQVTWMSGSPLLA